MDNDHNEPLLSSDERSYEDFVTDKQRNTSSLKLKIFFVVLTCLTVFVMITMTTWKSYNFDVHMTEPGNIYTTDDFNLTKENTTKNETFYHENVTHSSKDSKYIIPPPGYLVWSDKCKIPSLDPFAADMLKFFKPKKFENCSAVKPLTKINFDSKSKEYFLVIEEDIRNKYVTKNGTLNCTYRKIDRPPPGPNVEREYHFGPEKIFNTSFKIPTDVETLFVQCKGKQNYKNTHFYIPKRSDLQKRVDEWNMKYNKTRAPSVLMIGIDSISRANLMRAMPKVDRYLFQKGWFEMSGYNKIDDNTFPNLMAIFNGYNYTTAMEKCKPKMSGGLDKCPFLWFDFQKHGYITAYAEDETWMSSFVYAKKGFLKQPTDFYLQPFLIASGKNLQIKKRSGLIYCMGYTHSSDYVYDYAVEFAKTYKNDPHFGFFWTNSFSHNDLSDPTAMDDGMIEYLTKFERSGVLDDSIVIFFSDHGMRFGPARVSLAGRIEERLPMLFIWLPTWFQKQHPKYVDALKINRYRLTNPFDLHMTLKHILELSGRSGPQPLAPDCSQCQTLFKPVPYSRSCEDIAIEEHWCTCTPYESIESDSQISKMAVKFIEDYLNNYLQSFANGTIAKKCISIKTKTIKFINRVLKLASKNHSENIETYLVVIETNPDKAQFEVTLKYNIVSKNFTLSGTISRLDEYKNTAKCLTEDQGEAAKYCICKNRKKG